MGKMEVFPKGKTENFSQKLGAILMCLGIIIFIIFCIMVFSGKEVNSYNVPAAVAFLLVMLGISFLLPDMLKGGPNETISTMRVAVYMIVCVFIFLCIKYGWSVDSFAKMDVTSSWTYIVIAALGGKAVQSFGERSSIGGVKPQAPGAGGDGGSRTPQPGPSGQPVKPN
jgi:hypothetical protein